MFVEQGIDKAAATYADAPMRQAHKNKDPRGFAEFARMLSNAVSDSRGHLGMGNAARRTVLAHRSFEAVAEATSRLWQQVEHSVRVRQA